MTYRPMTERQLIICSLIAKAKRDRKMTISLDDVITCVNDYEKSKGREPVSRQSLTIGMNSLITRLTKGGVTIKKVLKTGRGNSQMYRISK